MVPLFFFCCPLSTVLVLCLVIFFNYYSCYLPNYYYYYYQPIPRVLCVWLLYRYAIQDSSSPTVSFGALFQHFWGFMEHFISLTRGEKGIDLLFFHLRCCPLLVVFLLFIIFFFILGRRDLFCECFFAFVFFFSYQ